MEYVVNNYKSKQYVHVIIVSVVAPGNTSTKRGAKSALKKAKCLEEKIIKQLIINVMRYLFFVVFVLILSSCKIHEKYIIRNLVNMEDSTIIVENNKIGKRFLFSRRKNQKDLPLISKYNEESEMCYLSLKSSGYEVKDFLFRPIELKNAIIHTDSSFDINGKFDYMETSIWIKSFERNKTIIIDIDNGIVTKISETVYGMEVRIGQTFHDLTFDKNGILIKDYEEYLY